MEMLERTAQSCDGTDGHVREYGTDFGRYGWTVREFGTKIKNYRRKGQRVRNGTFHAQGEHTSSAGTVEDPHNIMSWKGIGMYVPYVDAILRRLVFPELITTNSTFS
jgi:hypothetical protein